jgi:hypothetical protein
LLNEINEINEINETNRTSSMKLTIDPEFRDLIIPLKQDELANLEVNLVNHGCLDRLKTWNKTIIDGHNRYEICTRRGIPFKIHEMEFEDREAAMDWMDANQLGRRNLTKGEIKTIIGRRYNRTKKPRGAPENNQNAANQSGQNVHIDSKPPTTAETIAKEVNMDARTVRRAGEYVTAIGVLGLEEEVKKNTFKATDKNIIQTSKTAIPELVEMLRVGEIDFKTCSAAAKLSPEEQKKAVLGGVYGVNAAARGRLPAETKRIESHIPSDGKSCAVMAIVKLDRILDCDSEFEWAMNHIIAYCEKRMKNKK